MHFSYKTNSVAGVLRVIHGEGLGAEVVDAYELWLARRLGVPAGEATRPDVRDVVRVPVDDEGRQIGASPA